MSLATGLAPTRHSLLQGRRRLHRIDKGGELLTRKRQALVAELFRLARAAVERREEILATTASAYAQLLHALPLHGASTLESMGWPTREIEAVVEAVNVWGIVSAAIKRVDPVRRDWVARSTSPASTGPAAVGSAEAFETLIELLLDAATHEIQVRRVGDELTSASRQLNHLERRVRPSLASQVAQTQRILEEREREEHTRLRLLRGRTRSVRA